ncbi:glutamyl-tRNA amidotransferase subunit B [Ignicoccus islandicus DSM 13165]|uniref:Aspartyl/glutamyl-tRNA(Asn/Gln) amidotransferase subunit B n=1 Tax=Ignicoccus islandicus DSM 13165 TaxID=940295 RepID=A0A0U3E7Z7_9CREN|nr:Asp-tRNA(Asn)/Glu-tRNA(Gln) amidotransferase subunit GatB [Ignicoccus islandicus]ALU11502.1 glutamyl-tRNA amidotransferase subunit B [Ignicoccus islandicus DSM 13165]
MATIGLEVHVQLTSLKTKLFCSCPSDYRDKPPNTNVCPVCLGLPGALPILNERAVEMAVSLCLALKGKVSEKMVFARKHYFYPDLPKGFQISQFTKLGSSPICTGGYIPINVDGKEKVVRIRRVQLEEDPGRLVWPQGFASRYVLVDYNRSGVALLEIVTEPDMESPREARAFLEKLRSVLEHLGICDCSLEGAMRADANVSVPGGERVEVKNIGSPKEVEKALTFEIVRQTTLIKQGGKVERETRHWDSSKRVTIPSRSKEFEADYRYMPEPNIPPYYVSEEMIERIRMELPELPDERAERFVKEYKVSEYLAKVLTSSKKLADTFEEVAKTVGDPIRVANFLVVEYLRWVKELGMDIGEGLNAGYLKELFNMVDKGEITWKQAKEIVFPEVLKTGKRPKAIAKEKGLRAIKDVSEIEKIVEKVIKSNPKAVEDAKRNEKAINFLVGQVLKATKGRADPKLVREMIKEKISKS